MFITATLTTVAELQLRSHWCTCVRSQRKNNENIEKNTDNTSTRQIKAPARYESVVPRMNMECAEPMHYQQSGSTVEKDLELVRLYTSVYTEGQFKLNRVRWITEGLAKIMTRFTSIFITLI